MKKSIKTLIIFNLLCYFSYLLYTYAQLNVGITSWWVITAMLPYFLVMCSAFIVFHEDKKFKSLKIEAIIDLFVRIIALFINFTLKVFVKYSVWFNLIILAMLVLFLLNIYLEKRMYKKAVMFKEIRNNEKTYDFSWEDRVNFNNMDRAMGREMFEIPVMIFIFTTVMGLEMGTDKSEIIFFVLLDTCLFGYFLYHSYRSLILFYKDKIVARNTFVKENSVVLLAIILSAIFATFRILGYNSGIDPLLGILGMVPIYRNFIGRHKRAAKVNRMRKAKQEQL